MPGPDYDAFLINPNGSVTFFVAGKPALTTTQDAPAARQIMAEIHPGIFGDARPEETTKLTPQQEAAYQAWVAKNHIGDANDPNAHYDYRGAFLGGEKAGPDAHWHDTYKQHGHPTFSSESQYAKPLDKDFGYWNDDQFVAPLPPADLDASYAQQAQDVGPTFSLAGMSPARKPIQR